MEDSVINKFQNKNILLTGSNGYLAHALCSLLAKTKCRIIAMDIHQITPFLPSKIRKIKIIKRDIRNPDVFSEILKPIDIVFHFAAQTSVYKANDNPLDDMAINLLPMLHLLETCRSRKISPIIIFAGTATECGIPKYLPVDERHPDHPMTIYDLHKLAAENYLKYYVRQGFVKGAILRLANVYGPGPKSSSAERGVLNMMALRALQGLDLTLYGSGNFIRDYIYIDDVAEAFLYSASKIDKINGQHLIVGTGKGYKISEAFEIVAKRVEVRTGRTVKIRHVKPPSYLSPIETRNFIANRTRIKKLTGWKPSHGLVNGIDMMIDAFVNNTTNYAK